MTRFSLSRALIQKSASSVSFRKRLEFMNTQFHCVCVALLLAGPAFAAETTRPGAAGERGHLAVEIDRIVTNRMANGHIPGAVVTVVRGNSILFKKGYGLANLESKEPVDADKTLFRIASVSKTFTALAAMALIEAGKLDPDEDLRPRFQKAGLLTSSAVDGPLTCRALLSHSGGIRENFIPKVTLTTNAAYRLPLVEYLRQCEPLRWCRAGEVRLYSDTGITLAGYAVELAAERPFQEFVRAAVWQPLKMKNTCYVPEPRQVRYLARSYQHGKSGYEPIEFLYTSVDPAIGVMTTGGDMARMLVAHLRGGAGITGPRSRELMYQAQFAEDERLPSQTTCGLFVDSGRRRRELFHSGWALGYQSTMVLVPSQDIGIFVAQNANGPAVLTMGEVQRILFGEDSTPKREPRLVRTTKAQDNNLRAFTGTYLNNRLLSRGNPPEACGPLVVRYAETDDALEITFGKDVAQTIRWKEMGGMMFRSQTTGDAITFQESADGKEMYLIGYGGDGAYRRAPK